MPPDQNGRMGSRRSAAHCSQPQRFRRDSGPAWIPESIISSLRACSIKMRKTILALARDNYDAVFSGYTHMQPSEPVSFAHYLSAVLAGLARDYKRYANVWDSLNLCPLGGCSMGSTSYNIDRNYTAKLLGFNGRFRTLSTASHPAITS